MLLHTAAAVTATVPSYSGAAVAIGTAIILIVLAALTIWVLLGERRHR
ncbi:hypothetical protein [Nocardia heshunensis]